LLLIDPTCIPFADLPTPRRSTVEFALGKFRSDDEFLKTVHRIMFGTPGKATIIKKNIRAFSGLPDGDEKAKSRAEDILKRAFATTLNALLDLFDLPRGSGEDGKKEAKEKRIFDWLIKPTPSGNKNLKGECPPFSIDVMM